MVVCIFLWPGNVFVAGTRLIHFGYLASSGTGPDGLRRDMWYVPQGPCGYYHFNFSLGLGLWVRPRTLVLKSSQVMGSFCAEVFTTDMVISALEDSAMPGWGS